MESVVDRLNEIETQESRRGDYHEFIDSQKNTKYEDPLFKPDDSSMFSKYKKKHKESFKKEWSTNGKFMRISEIAESKGIKASVVNDISVKDVKQGQLGNCYFMATLTTLVSQQPNLIKRMFITREYNETGIYSVKIYINGAFKIIEIDDYIPVDKTTKTPLFAQMQTSNIWPMLLEKAWAKVNGSYEDIISGNPKEAMKFLTPFVSKMITINDSNTNIDAALKIYFKNF